MKIIIYFILIATLIGIIGFVGINGTKNIVEEFSLITEQTAPEIIVLGKIAEFSEILQVEAVGFALIRAEKAEEEEEEELSEFAVANQELDKKIEELESREEGHRHEFEKDFGHDSSGLSIKEIKESKEELYNAAQALIDAKKQGKSGEDILEIKEELESVEENFRKIIDTRIEVENKELQERDKKSHDTANRTTLIIISTSILAVFITIALGFFISRKITKPIEKLSKTVDEVSKGNFDVKMDIKTGIKEINVLAKSLNRVMSTMKLSVLRKDPVVIKKSKKRVSGKNLAKLDLVKSVRTFEKTLKDINKEKNSKNKKRLGTKKKK